MTGSLYLAWRYLRSHPVKAIILVASITLILYIPMALRVLVGKSQRSLTARAEATPLLVGMKGSPTELTLNSLYFSSDVPERLTFAAVERIASTGYADPVPLYVRFRANRDPIVGTSVDYFELRRLRVGRGRLFAMLGECVLGSRVAAARRLGPGDTIISSPESVFDLAGVYPLKMRVTGVLEPSDSSDDEAVFVDVKTAWVIEGLGHGHEDLTRPEAAPRVLRRDGKVVVGNASVVQFNEITKDNIDSFHFHGDVSGFPVTAVIAYPKSEKSATLLRGRFLSPDERLQILRPTTVMEDLLDTVLTIEGFVVAAIAVVGAGTIATIALVIWLSLRLRKREIETMAKIGGSRLSIVTMIVMEVAVVLLVGVCLAGALTAVTTWVGSDLVWSLV